VFPRESYILLPFHMVNMIIVELLLYPITPALAVSPMNLIQRRLSPPSMGATLLEAHCNHFTGQVIDN